MKSILVWDIPTRLFHWLFALSFTVAFVTAEADGWAATHVFVGLLMLGLIAYRLIWGVIGSRYARFSSFLFSPATATQYLIDTANGRAKRHLGHNPTGSWMIYVMLLLAAGIGIFGLATLSSGDQFEEVHQLLSSVVVGLIFAHIAGVVVASLMHRENLLRSLVTGRKAGDEPQGIRSVRPISALVMLVLVASFSVFYWQGWDPQTQSVRLPFLDQPLVLNEHGENHHSAWVAEED